MLKEKISKTIFMGITLVIIITAASGCGTSSSEDNNNSNTSDPLVGVWVEEDYPKSGFIFYEDGTGYNVQSGNKFDTWWSADENTISLENENTSYSFSYRFSNSNDTLTINFNYGYKSSTITYNRSEDESVFNGN